MSEPLFTVLQDAKRLAALAFTSLGPDPDPAFDGFARLVRAAVGTPVALVSLVGDERQVFPGQCGLPEPWATSRQTPLSHSFCQHVVATGQPLVVSDARLDERLKDNLAIPDLDVIAYAGYPLMDDAGNVLGSLCAIDHQPRQFSAADREVLRDLALACSSELQLRLALAGAASAQQHAERERAKAEAALRAAEVASSRLAMLASATGVVSATLDLDEALTRIGHLVVPLLADWAAIGRIDDGEIRLAATANHPWAADGAHSTPPIRLAQADDGPLAQVARGALPFAVLTHEDIHTDPARLGPIQGPQTARLRETDAQSAMLVGLGSWGRVRAVLVLVRGVGSAPFSDSERQLALDLATAAAVAVDNASLFSQVRDASLILQRSLLTAAPQPDHLVIATRYIPAAADTEVGGDWYDAFLQPDGATVLVVGDVAGHDVQAAAAMGQLRGMLRGIGFAGSASPAQILSAVDQTLRGLEIATLATALVVRIEQDDELHAQGLRRARWSNAGHPPMLLLHADGRTEFAEARSEVLLGVNAEQARTDHTLLLRPDDTLLLFTDGLVEHRGESLDVGLDRLRAAAGALAHLDSPDALADELLARLAPAGGAEDDIAIIALRARPEV